MTRPPKARPPPATVRPNELRRHQLRSYQREGGLSPKGMFHPPVPAVGNAESRTLSRSFSSSSMLGGDTNEPDNTSILRGAQILRQQFMERQQQQQQSRTRGGGANKSNGKDAERLFPAKNDEAYQDLLGIQPIQPPGSPNDVTLSFHHHAPNNHQYPDWTDPWNLRGSAFDPAFSQIRDQRHEILFGSFPPTPILPEQQQQQQRSCAPKQQQPQPRESSNNNNKWQSTTHSPKRWQQQQATPSSPQWKSTPSFPTSSQRPPPPSPKWQSTPAIQYHLQGDNDDTNDKETSEQDTNTADITGPVPLDRANNPSSSEQDTSRDDTITGPIPLESSYNNGQEQTTTLSDDFASLERKSSSNNPRRSSNLLPMSYWMELAHTDAQAFDNFIDSVSLDDQALEELVNAQDEERVALPNRRHPWDMRGAFQSNHKKKERHHNAAKPRGRPPQRSFSSAGVTTRPTHPRPRAHSAGVERRQYQAAATTTWQSSLRDDLLCGMETSCQAELEKHHDQMIQTDDLLVEDVCEPCRPESRSTGSSSYRNSSRRYESFSSSLQVVIAEEDRFSVLSPGSEEYGYLQRTDLAFQHAVHGGGLWQALVGNHVRFPKQWWQGHHRTAPLGCPKKVAEGNRWEYYDRHRIKGNSFLKQVVRKRDEPGQILLHLVVRDFMTSSPILDIAIGCFHPNAKSIRTTHQPNKRLEDCRDVWMATRFRTKDMISVIDPTFLSQKIGTPKKTPLGDSKRRISNTNVRAIFGESPPLRTAFVLESDIYEMLAAMDGADFQVHGAAEVLLEKYVFRSYANMHSKA